LENNLFRSSPRLKKISDPHLDKIYSALTELMLYSYLSNLIFYTPWKKKSTNNRESPVLRLSQKFSRRHKTLKVAPMCSKVHGFSHPANIFRGKEIKKHDEFLCLLLPCGPSRHVVKRVPAALLCLDVVWFCNFCLTFFTIFFMRVCGWIRDKYPF